VVGRVITYCKFITWTTVWWQNSLITAGPSTPTSSAYESTNRTLQKAEWAEWEHDARPGGTPAVDITAVTSSGHVTSPVTSPIDSDRPLYYRIPIVNDLLLSPVVSEIQPQRRTRATLTKRHPGTHLTPQPTAGELTSFMFGKQLSAAISSSLKQSVLFRRRTFAVSWQSSS